jgi:hypothetical protein
LPGAGHADRRVRLGPRYSLTSSDNPVLADHICVVVAAVCAWSGQGSDDAGKPGS